LWAAADSFYRTKKLAKIISGIDLPFDREEYDENFVVCKKFITVSYLHTITRGNIDE
jgi:hypothetical protein